MTETGLSVGGGKGLGGGGGSKRHVVLHFLRSGFGRPGCGARRRRNRLGGRLVGPRDHGRFSAARARSGGAATTTTAATATAAREELHCLQHHLELVALLAALFVQSGQKRNKLKVVLENVQFLSRGGGSGSGGGGGGAAAASAGSGEAPVVAGADEPPAEPVSPPARAASRPPDAGPQKVEDDVPF